ncbi:hypothetical protein N7535_003967 [Penicillium sp. DV-2018c]|nr:hypothetical protein N7461_000333 [Penicillium sp. DV-2018c]KAJ5577041.1 hypothetical protein N7535_003967 [Penicillium sp. DV-2018c]
MSQQGTPPLKTYFDELEETNGDDECKAWLNSLFDAKDELAAFVAGRRIGGRSNAKYVGYLKGSFNFSFHFSFDDGLSDVIIRFPKPGHTATAFRDEKVVNEVQIMEYLRENTDIPIPRVHSWGLTAESPQHLGPFIIMDYVKGTLLSTILKQPDQETMVLNPDIDYATLDKIYYQIASCEWNVTGRPLTYNMNKLATDSGYPVDQFPTAPFDRTSDYLSSIAKEHLTHLWTQRNIVDDERTAQKRFIVRHQFAKLIPKYYPEDSGLFIPFCDDMRPSNMLIDPETLQITAVLDFEYTNAMPAEFTYDPPWWLLLSGPEMWLERGAKEEFLTLYKPRMEQFVQALQRVEVEVALKGQRRGKDPLSIRMLDSWRLGDFGLTMRRERALMLTLSIGLRYMMAVRVLSC